MQRRQQRRVVFAMGVVRSFFSPERTRALLAGRREGVGNAMAASLGIVTPFCSCSAVPLFIGFVSAGVPLGVTFSFLIAAPMVNEVALGLLFVLLGWRVALTYLVFGLGIAITAGWIIGKLKLEGWLEPWVLKIHAGTADLPGVTVTWPVRIRAGLESVQEIVGHGRSLTTSCGHALAPNACCCPARSPKRVASGTCCNPLALRPKRAARK